MKAILCQIAFVAALGALISTSSSACAQESSLSPIVVRGKVLSLQMESNESYRLKFNVDVELRFINVSNHNVIIAKRDLVWIEYPRGDWDENAELVFEASEEQGPLRYTEIDRSSPPADKVAILAPGSAYVTHSRIPLEFSRDNSGNFDDYGYPKSLRATLKLTLKSWIPVVLTWKEQEEMEDVPSEEAMFESLRTKWAGMGELVSREIEAEPIEVRLPPEPQAPQPTGLVLRGSVTSVGAKRETKDEVIIDVGLQLEFVNSGKKPVIVLKPKATGYGDYWIVSTGLMSDPTTKGNPSYLTRWYMGPSCAGSSPESDAQRDAMDRPEPPEDHFWMIPPGGSQAFSESTHLRFDKRRGQSGPEPKAIWSDLSGVRNFWIDVRLQVWPTTLIEPVCGGTDNPVFSRKLRDRWSRFGTLEMGEFGMISSQPMPLTLPTE